MIIEVKDLLVDYGDNENAVLKISEFTLPERGQLAILGRSGSGKTTFLNVLSGVLRPAAGNVKICGTELTCLKNDELDNFRARNIGYIFQNLNLLQAYTALENIEIALKLSGAKYDRSEILENLSAAGLSREINKYPYELSLGQQQRIAVIRSVMKKPALILADEPTSSLDAENSDFVLEILKENTEKIGAALILVSHEPDVINSFEHKLKFNEINKF